MNLSDCFPSLTSYSLVGVKEARPLVVRATDKIFKIRYIQRNTQDPHRNWQSYKDWKKDNPPNQLVRNPELPDFDLVYHLNASHVDSGLISPFDKILLHVDFEKIGNSCISLNMMYRNMDPSLKGIGASFHRHLTKTLKTSGADILTVIPASKEVEDKVWRKLGYVPVKDLPHKVRLKIPRFTELALVI